MANIILALLLCLFASVAEAGRFAWNKSTNRIVEMKRGGAPSGYAGKAAYGTGAIDDEDPLFKHIHTELVYDPETKRPVLRSQESKKSEKKSEIESRLTKLQELKANTTNQSKLDALADLEIELNERLAEEQ